MVMFQTRSRITMRKLAVFAAVGFLIGSALGYIFMATVHAVRRSATLRFASSCHPSASALPLAHRRTSYASPQMLEIRAESHYTEAGQAAKGACAQCCLSRPPVYSQCRIGKQHRSSHVVRRDTVVATGIVSAAAGGADQR